MSSGWRRLVVFAAVATGLAVLIASCRSDPSLKPETPHGEESGSYGSALDFMVNPLQVEGFSYDPLPKRPQADQLPRSIGTFTLGSAAPPNGLPYRDSQEVLYIENSRRTHRLRVFSRAGIIFRLLSYTRLPDADLDDHTALIARIIATYGKPARQLIDELTYVDHQTVLIISIGGKYLITDIADAENGEFAPHIYDLLDKVYR